jgi:hypothetical protein
MPECLLPDVVECVIDGALFWPALMLKQLKLLAQGTSVFAAHKQMFVGGNIICR